MIKHKLHLTVHWNERKKKWLAVITDGDPRSMKKDVMVLDAELFKKKEDATPWFEKKCKEMPWLKNS